MRIIYRKLHGITTQTGQNIGERWYNCSTDTGEQSAHRAYESVFVGLPKHTVTPVMSRHRSSRSQSSAPKRERRQHLIMLQRPLLHCLDTRLQLSDSVPNPPLDFLPNDVISLAHNPAVVLQQLFEFLARCLTIVLRVCCVLVRLLGRDLELVFRSAEQIGDGFDVVFNDFLVLG